MHLLRRELEILRLADHPNIVKHFETSEAEEVVATLIRTLLMAINHLHGLGIIHRDVKPENLLYGSVDPEADVKIIDFGMSNRLQPGFHQLHSMVGTPYYLAPEVLSGTYGKECDVWSLGVVAYVFLCGRQPFQGSELKDIFQKILKAEFTYEGTEWETVSGNAKDLLSRMMKADPKHRITVEQALHHPWLASNPRLGDAFIQPRVLLSLKRFKAPKKLQQEAMKIIVKNLSTEEIKDLRNAFIQMDREKTGFISAADLEAAMTLGGYNIASEEVKSKC